jgi:hypothetical protein
MKAPTILYILALAALLSGCATNGVTVHEKTAEGYEFSMEQKTSSTIFAHTEEGAGSVDYEGQGPDSSFKLRAGAAVKGQDGGDPSALVLGVLQAIMPVISQKPEPPRQSSAINPEDVEAAIKLIEE